MKIRSFTIPLFVLTTYGRLENGSANCQFAMLNCLSLEENGHVVHRSLKYGSLSNAN